MKKCIFLLCALLLLPVITVGAVDMDIPAKSAVLMDIATGQVLYEKNAHERRYPASITKEEWEKTIRETVPPKFLEINLAAFEKGYTL